VVSGDPNSTPIFSRSWLMKMAVVLDLEMVPESLRRAWLMRRAWRPTWESPISPSISARGTERRHRVDHDDVESARANQHVGDLEGLLAGVRLGDQQLVGVDPEVAGVGHVRGRARRR
jgi:hypothetical protein